jgi:hypothetical protein
MKPRKINWTTGGFQISNTPIRLRTLPLKNRYQKNLGNVLRKSTIALNEFDRHKQKQTLRRCCCVWFFLSALSKLSFLTSLTHRNPLYLIFPATHEKPLQPSLQKQISIIQPPFPLHRPVL